MKKMMTLAEVKNFFGDDRCFETETSFLFNDFGKYRPNLTFVIPKEFELDKDGKLISPLRYVEDKAVTDNMNLDFDGSAVFLFGDFWHSKKGGACFRPKDPISAKHLLIKVNWGGAFNRSRGNYPEDVSEIPGILYFRHAASNGGGNGHDYWVVPVGYFRMIHDPEVDGEATSNDTGSLEALYEKRARDYRQRHADMLETAYLEADSCLRDTMATEALSREAKAEFLPRLMKIQSELAELHEPKKFAKYGVDEITFGGAYFEIGAHKWFYSDFGLKKAEEHLVQTREWVVSAEAEKQKKANARKAHEAEFERLRPEIEKLGMKLSFDEDGAVMKNPDDVWEYSHYSFSNEGVQKLRRLVAEKLDEVAERELAIKNAERIRGLMLKTQLPAPLWAVFMGSEEDNGEIIRQVNAIIEAACMEKTEQDLHELLICGYNRRCNAVRRLLKKAGGDFDKLNVGSQAISIELARFIAEGGVKKF